MFLCNKYTRCYYSIIDKAKKSQRTGYTERHHIIPKSLGGGKSKDNLVTLSAREHFICHLLLTKMVGQQDRYKMAWALHRMAFSECGQRRFSSKEFELARVRFSLAMTGRKLSNETKRKISTSNTGKKRSPETKALLSTIFTGFTFSKERNAKISISNTGKKHTFSEEHKKNISSSKMGCIYSDERNAKISEKLSGKPKTESHRSNISAALIGKKKSADHIAKSVASRALTYKRRKEALADTLL